MQVVWCSTVDAVRCRELFDLVVVEIRRNLIGERPIKPIKPGELRCTRYTPFTKYAAYLTELEFVQFLTLTRNLSPRVVKTIGPHHRRAIEAGDAAAVRCNLESVVYGILDAKPLFQDVGQIVV